VGFLLALSLYAIVFSRRPAIRWGMICVAALGVLIGVSFSGRVMDYISRGQNAEALSSLNERTRVWEASWEAIRVGPVLGYGYSVGARNAIRDHWRSAHWVPPHAHNEFIQSTLDGGIVALLLVLWVYGHVLFASIREIARGPCQLFLFIAFVQFALSALTSPELSYEYLGTGGVLVLCCIGVLAGAPEKAGEYRAVRRTTSSALNSSLQGSSV